MGKLKFGFRLISLAVIAYCIVASIGVWNSSAADRFDFLRLMRAEGNLPAGHESEIQVHPIPNKEEMAWQWRISVPGDFTFVSFLVDGMIASDAPKAADSSVKLFESDEGSFFVGDKPREFEFAIALGKTRGGIWEMHIRNESQRKSFAISDSAAAMLDDASGKIELVTEQQPTYFDTKNPLLLFRLRETTTNAGAEFAPGICWYLVPLVEKDSVSAQLGRAAK